MSRLVKSASEYGGGDGGSRSAEDKMVRTGDGGGSRGKLRRYGSASESKIFTLNYSMEFKVKFGTII